MEGLRQILRVSWTARKANNRALEKAGESVNLLSHIKTRRLWYFGHIMRHNNDCLEKDLSGARKRGGPKTLRLNTTTDWTNKIESWKRTTDNGIIGFTNRCIRDASNLRRARQDKAFCQREPVSVDGSRSKRSISCGSCSSRDVTLSPWWRMTCSVMRLAYRLALITSATVHIDNRLSTAVVFTVQYRMYMAVQCLVFR